MDKKLWKQVSAVFHEASALSGEAREQFLHEACDGDDELRREVDALLSAPVDSTPDIDDAVAAVAAEYVDRLSTGKRIGPYRLVGVIGRGGMGQVFLAERVDREFEQQVAIKTVAWMGATAALIERFRIERQILADLDHRYIARLLDGGSTENDAPYLVMEYVDGQNIIEYCREQHLSIKQKLRLFLKICDAVQYAHRQLVIHRDIKPTNILVTADGTPKLLDFGIAKLVDAGADVTHADKRFVSAQYASPEQLSGEVAGTATDVYGLGLLLYQMLTDVFPYPIEGSTSPEIERLIRETEPIAPSAAVSSGDRRKHALKGDLDNIVLMAMRKEAERRYETAKDMADDVLNFLDKRPVSARTPSFGYRAGKFLARNRVGVVAVSAAVLVAITMTVFYTQRLASERDIAQRERLAADAATEFMVDLFDVNTPQEALGETITAREVLDRGAAKLSQDLDDSPRVRARLLRTVGRVYERLGLYEQARGFLEQSIELYRSEVSDAEIATAETLEELAWIYYRSEDWDEAHTAAAEALARREAQVGAGDKSLAGPLNYLGTVAYWQDDFDGALGYYNRALALLDGNDKKTRVARATTLSHLGITYDTMGRDIEAEKVYLESLQIRLSLYGENHPATATINGNLASLYSNRGDLERAAEYVQKALVTHRAMHGDVHVNVAFDLTLLARIERDRGNLALSLDYAKEALHIWAETLGRSHGRYVDALDVVATIYMAMDNYDEALVNADRANRIALTTNGEMHTQTANTLFTLGTVFHGLGRLDEAREVLLRAGRVRLDIVGEENRGYWDVQQLLSLVDYESGNLKSAEELIAATLVYVETHLPDDEERLVLVLDRYTAVLERIGDNEAKLAELRERRVVATE